MGCKILVLVDVELTVGNTYTNIDAKYKLQ